MCAHGGRQIEIRPVSRTGRTDYRHTRTRFEGPRDSNPRGGSQTHERVRAITPPGVIRTFRGGARAEWVAKTVALTDGCERFHGLRKLLRRRRAQDERKIKIFAPAHTAGDSYKYRLLIARVPLEKARATLSFMCFLQRTAPPRSEPS